MLLVKKNVLRFNFILIILFNIFISISSYFFINKINSSKPIMIKYYSEVVILFMLIFLLISMTSYFLMISKSLKISKELDKIIDITKYGNYDIEKSLVRLSYFGEKIKDLHHNLNILNEQKSLKISSLSNILSFFLNSTELNILITDIEGFITNISLSFTKNFEIDISKILYSSINSIKSINFVEAILSLDRDKEKIVIEKIDIEIGKKNYKVNIILIPIFNIKKELSNILFVIEKIGFLSISKLDFIK